MLGLREVLSMAVVAGSLSSVVVGSDINHNMTTLEGKEVDLAKAYEGKVLLIVNVASRCGLTPQYDGLQALHERFAARGLVVVAVPSNDFMGQEPGTDAEIASFCSLNYGVTFPLMAKAVVRGADAHPFFAWLQADSAIPGPVTWNFAKALIGRDGRLRARFEPRVAPDDARLVAAIEAALAVEP